MDNQNPVRGLRLNLNRNNINFNHENAQLLGAQPHQQAATGGGDLANLDNLKAAALSLENPQPAPTSMTTKTDNENLIKGLQLNLNKKNQLLSDKNAQLLSSPAPPKLKSGTRTSMQVLPAAGVPALTNNSNNQQQQQQQARQAQPPVARQNLENLIDLELDLDARQEMPTAGGKAGGHQQQVPESLISRIPRLSLKPALALLPQNRNLANGGKPNTRLSTLREATTKREQAAAPMAIVDEDEGEAEEIEDIDKTTSRDAMFLVCDIAKDIYEYMYQLEEEQSIKKDYLKDQKIFTPNVRHRLVNWCIEVNSKLGLLPETLYMTISVIDRFFDKVQVKQQSQVQLVAAGATLIASKYEEIYPPDIGDLVHLTQNACSRRDIMKVEIYILEQLKFNLGKPIPAAFLRRFSRAAHCDQKMHSIAKYLMELSLYEYECSHWRPSLLAAAALFVSLHINRQENLGLSALRHSLKQLKPASPVQPDRWTKALVHYTHYTRAQLRGPAAVLAKVLKKSQKSPQSYSYCVKKHSASLNKWTELKSIRVDELIKMGEQQ